MIGFILGVPIMEDEWKTGLSRERGSDLPLPASEQPGDRGRGNGGIALISNRRLGRHG